MELRQLLATDLITNGAFANNGSGWTKSGAFRADAYFSSSAGRSNPGYAYLAAGDGQLASSNNLNGSIYQTVSIPPNATSAKLSFWHRFTTQETGGTYDKLRVRVRSSSGSLLATPLTLSNSSSTSSYQQRTVDLLAHKGKTIRVCFEGTTDYSLGTIFRIDDVSLNVEAPAAPATPSGPSNLTASAVSSSRIDLAWSDNSNNETGFKIERRTGSSSSWSQIATVNAGVKSYQDTGLAASTTHTYRVRAYNSAGNSGYTSEKSATTQDNSGSGDGIFNTNAGAAVDAPLRGDINNRNPDLYDRVIDQFHADTNPRYDVRVTPYSNGERVSFCNIASWDITRAMGAEIPHYVPSTQTYGGQFTELNANRTYDWLRDYGNTIGWRRVTQGGAEAQRLANLGHPVVAVWRHPSANAAGLGPSGHVMIVRPGNWTDAAGATVAQAGGYTSGGVLQSNNFSVGKMFGPIPGSSFAAPRNDIAYFVNDTGRTTQGNTGVAFSADFNSGSAGSNGFTASSGSSTPTIGSSFGSASPSNGTGVMHINNANASANTSNFGGTAGSIVNSTSFVVPQNGRLMLDFNFLTNENTPDSTYNDFAMINIVAANGAVLQTLRTIDTYHSFVGASGSGYARQTGWIHSEFSLANFAGQSVRLQFVVSDRGDTAFDSGLLIDNLRVT